MSTILTPTQLRALVVQNLADESEILPVEHREVEDRLIDLLEDILNKLPILTGVYTVGDNNGVDTIRTINIPNIGTSNYYVTGSFQSKGSNYDADNDVFWMFKNPTSTSFQLTMRETSNNVQNLDFHWEIKKHQ
jgi:hypothetical protein